MNRNVIKKVLKKIKKKRIEVFVVHTWFFNKDFYFKTDIILHDGNMIEIHKKSLLFGYRKIIDIDLISYFDCIIDRDKRSGEEKVFKLYSGIKIFDDSLRNNMKEKIVIKYNTLKEKKIFDKKIKQFIKKNSY